MNEHCEKLVNSVISSNKKVTLDYLLDLCDEYDLTPAEVDWVAEKLLELHRIKTNDIPTDSVHGTQEKQISILPLPVNRNEICDYSFQNHQELENVVIPDTIETIGNGAFVNCKHLKSIVVPSSVKYIGDDCFLGCAQLKEVVFRGDLPQGSLYLLPLLNSNVDRLVIYGKVEKNQMLRGSLSIYDKLKIILYSTALSDCYEIFGEHCFLCIEGFAYAALRGDTFDDVVYKKNQSYIKQHYEALFYYGVVKHDSSLMEYLYNYDLLPNRIHKKTLDSIFPEELRSKLTTKIQVLNDYEKVFPLSEEAIKKYWKYVRVDNNSTIAITSYRGDNIDYIRVPNMIDGTTVSHISQYAFSCLRDFYRNRSIFGKPSDERYVLRKLIKEIELPNTIQSIADNAFEYCSNLTINIPASVTSIGENAFEGCRNLTVIAPKGSYAMKYALKHRLPVQGTVESSETRFTIVGIHAYGNRRFLQNGTTIEIYKEPENEYDPYAVRVEIEGVGCVGHIANSARTIRLGCTSSKEICDMIGTCASATIVEAYPQYAIAILNEAKDNCDEQSL